VLASLPSSKYHITLAVARYIEHHEWKPLFAAQVDEIFYLQGMTNDSTVQAEMLDYLVKSRNVKLVINSRTVAGYDSFQRWCHSNNQKFKNLVMMDILHMQELQSRDSWEWRAAQNANAMTKRIVVSQNLKDYLVNVIGQGDPILGVAGSFRPLSAQQKQKIEVIYPPLSFSGQRIDSSSNRPTLLFVGRMERQKMPHLFLDVASLLPNEIDVHMIGGGTLLHALKTYCIQHSADLYRRTRFIGDIPHENVQKHLVYSSASIFLLTSSHEGVPIVIMEALSLGIPVVTPKCGGLLEIISDSVWKAELHLVRILAPSGIEYLVHRYMHASVIMKDCTQLFNQEQNSTIYRDFRYVMAKEVASRFSNLHSDAHERKLRGSSFLAKYSSQQFQARWRSIIDDVWKQ
jgi:glycosyltransferase involved in cell wall biosynthesis